MRHNDIDSDVSIDGVKLEQAGAAWYGLRVYIVGSARFYPARLLMQIDGELLDFGYGLQLQLRERGDRHHEKYWHETTAERLWQIAEADSVKVILSNSRDEDIERAFKPENIANFMDFCLKHVPPPK